MFEWKFVILIFNILLSGYILVGSKTAEDEAKGNIGSLGGSSKNFSSNENTLAPHSIAPSVEPAPAIQRECKDSTFESSFSCAINLQCSKLGGNCLNCNFNCSCIYGQTLNVTCSPKAGVWCSGPKTFSKEMVCQYCFQMPHWQYDCSGSADCPAVNSPQRMFKANCTVRSDVLCLGNRKFLKNIPCNWTSGYRWSTTLLLSITLGGFGADRFYLGHWQEGIGKLFSFGGLGVWTIIDVILVAVRYLGPANNSLYI